MTQFRVSQHWLSRKFYVQRKPDLWPFWSVAFWQRFDTYEEAQGLLKIFEDSDTRILSPSKSRSRNLVTYRIKLLEAVKLHLVMKSRRGGIAHDVRLDEIHQKLSRLYQMRRKLIMH